MYDLNKYALKIPNILLPADHIDMRKWAVIACDQFSSQPGYWEEVARTIGDSPSTYHMIYPECYLDEGTGRIGAIHRAMEEYKAHVLTRTIHGFVLVERETNAGHRLGLVAAIDLEQYDFSPDSKSLIRPTEGTIVERLPPRIAIRQNAALETPHVMILVDDPGHTLIEPLYAKREALESLYDFDLMSGGRICGWAVDREAEWAEVAGALEGLYQKCAGLLFAVGDGNHSLAAARQCWLDMRDSLNDAQRIDHPARYALVEICNLHDPAMAFEPIHRAVFGAERPALVHDFVLWCRKEGVSVVPCAEETAQIYLLDAPVRLENAFNPLAVSMLQPFLDEWLSEHPQCRIDYIHGEDALKELGNAGTCCIRLSAMDKYALFESVRRGGPLPRKTFSLGEAKDKRYYVECRGLI